MVAGLYKTNRTVSVRGRIQSTVKRKTKVHTKKNGIEICIISYMKPVASLGSMHDTGCLGLVHWDDPEGWYGEGGGFRVGNTCIPVADSF